MGKRVTCKGCGSNWVTYHDDESNVECPKCGCKLPYLEIRALVVTRPTPCRRIQDPERAEYLADQRSYRAAIGGAEDPDVSF